VIHLAAQIYAHMNWYHRIRPYLIEEEPSIEKTRHQRHLDHAQSLRVKFARFMELRAGARSLEELARHPELASVFSEGAYLANPEAPLGEARTAIELRQLLDNPLPVAAFKPLLVDFLEGRLGRRALAQRVMASRAFGDSWLERIVKPLGEALKASSIRLLKSDELPRDYRVFDALALVFRRSEVFLFGIECAVTTQPKDKLAKLATAAQNPLLDGAWVLYANRAPDRHSGDFPTLGVMRFADDQCAIERYPILPERESGEQVLMKRLLALVRRN